MKLKIRVNQFPTTVTIFSPWKPIQKLLLFFHRHPSGWRMFPDMPLVPIFLLSVFLTKAAPLVYWFCLMFVPKFPKCSVSMYLFPAQQIGQDGVWTQTMAHYMHSSLLILALCSQLSNEVWNALSFLCTLLRCLRCDWWHYRISLMLRKHLLIDHNCGVLSTVGEATMFRIP